MKVTFKKILLALFLNLLAFAAFAGAGADTNLSGMLKSVRPSVVNIAATGEVSMMLDPSQVKNMNIPEGAIVPDPDASPDQPGGLLPVKRKFVSVGSGVIVDAKRGYILTNAHVIKDAKSIMVTLSDGRKFLAKPIGLDSQSDIGALQIKPDHSILHAIDFADSDKVKVGERVYAIGNPFGIGQTVTSGIVSGLGRNNLHIENFEDFIQTDASINPGNSGGALIDTDGKMIGVNTAILAPTGGNIGIGFAIPSNMARSVMVQLIKYGSIHRGFMGVVVNDISPDIAQSFNVPEDSGALIAMVTPNSPAAKAGLQVGDIVTSINGKPMKNAAALKNYIGLLQVGAKLDVDFLRNGKKQSVRVVTIDPDSFSEQLENSNPFLYGLDLENFNAQTVVAGHLKGVMIVNVQSDSPAWRAGLMGGDVILSANHKPITDLSDLNEAVKSRSDQLLLNVYRPSSHASSFVVVH